MNGATRAQQIAAIQAYALEHRILWTQFKTTLTSFRSHVEPADLEWQCDNMQINDAASMPNTPLHPPCIFGTPATRWLPVIGTPGHCHSYIVSWHFAWQHSRGTSLRDMESSKRARPQWFQMRWSTCHSYGWQDVGTGQLGIARNQTNFGWQSADVLCNHHVDGALRRWWLWCPRTSSWASKTVICLHLENAASQIVAWIARLSSLGVCAMMLTLHLPTFGQGIRKWRIQ